MRHGGQALGSRVVFLFVASFLGVFDAVVPSFVGMMAALLVAACTEVSMINLVNFAITVAHIVAYVVSEAVFEDGADPELALRTVLANPHMVKEYAEWHGT